MRRSETRLRSGAGSGSRSYGSDIELLTQEKTRNEEIRNPASLWRPLGPCATPHHPVIRIRIGFRIRFSESNSGPFLRIRLSRGRKRVSFNSRCG
ncbi:hypothetical protein B296_00001632 [Ensete ventricosum]|uniref:Uncharacterized protein n=1 Tax=Ensete ventricosum TaxID=4639 RepID=A0A427B526_ENSVE|nr:hypothetical protein B296_00001632 [Ensete ventricosum]